MQKANLEQFLTVSLHTITFDVHIFTYQGIMLQNCCCSGFDILSNYTHNPNLYTNLQIHLKLSNYNSNRISEKNTMEMI